MDQSLVPPGYARKFYEHDLPNLVKELKRLNDTSSDLNGLKILLGLTATETLVRAGKSPDDARAFIAELIGVELPNL